MSFYLARSGQQEGPYDLDAIRQMLATGAAKPHDLVRRDGTTEWAPISQLIPAAPSAVPLPPMQAQAAAGIGGQRSDFAAPPAPAAGVAAGGARWSFAPSAEAAFNPIAGVPTGPMPPTMSVMKLFLLVGVTLGFFWLIWAFVEANFIKKIAPKHNGRGTLVLVVAATLVFILTALIVFLSPGALGISPEQLGIAGGMLFPILWVLAFVAVFRMRRGMQDYYGPTQAKLFLSPPLTAVLNIYYVQYHLRRMALWQQTGQLSA